MKKRVVKLAALGIAGIGAVALYRKLSAKRAGASDVESMEIDLDEEDDEEEWESADSDGDDWESAECDNQKSADTKVARGGDTKLGMERQVYRDFCGLIKRYDEHDLIKCFGEERLDEKIEARVAKFSKKGGFYIENSMETVYSVEGKYLDGARIEPGDCKKLIGEEACKVAFVEMERLGGLEMTRYRELWYTMSGKFICLDSIDYKHNFYVTCRNVIPMSEAIINAFIPLKDLLEMMENIECSVW